MYHLWNRLLERKLIARLLPFAVIVGCAFLAAARLNAEEPAGETKSARARKEQDAAFRVIQPVQRAISAAIGQASFVEAYERTSIYPMVPGFVEKWNVDIGDRVKKGQVLATLFAPEIIEELEAKQAQVKLAEARIRSAERALKVRQAGVKTAEARVAAARASLKKNNPSQEEAEAAVLVAQAELAEKQAAVAQAESAVEIARARRTVAVSEARKQEALAGYLKLIAPYDGVITARNANSWGLVMPPAGNGGRSGAVPAGDPGAPLYVIDRADTVRVFVEIPEEYANDVAAGTKATVKIAAYRDKPIAATVTRVSWALDKKSRSLRAEIDLPNPALRILPGMYAYGKVYIDSSRRAWALPADALQEVGGKFYYWEYRKGRALRREVQRGRHDGKWVEITQRRVPDSGGDEDWEPIDGSEKVLVGDLSTLTDGEAVKPTNPPSSP